VGRNRLRTPGQPQGCGFDSRALRHLHMFRRSLSPTRSGMGTGSPTKDMRTQRLQVGPAARAVS